MGASSKSRTRPTKDTTVVDVAESVINAFELLD
jgi:hypothetical protein